MHAASINNDPLSYLIFSLMLSRIKTQVLVATSYLVVIVTVIPHISSLLLYTLFEIEWAWYL